MIEKSVLEVIKRVSDAKQGVSSIVRHRPVLHPNYPHKTDKNLFKNNWTVFMHYIGTYRYNTIKPN